MVDDQTTQVATGLHMELEDVVMSGSFWTDKDGHTAQVIFVQSEEYCGQLVMRVVFWYKKHLIDILTTASSWLNSMDPACND